MFTYAEAEKTLGQLYYVPNERVLRGAFRARLKHLKRLGVPLNSNPGKGVKVAYEAEHLYQWAFCLELAEFGLDPTIIVNILKANWKTRIFKEFQKAEQMWRRAIKADPDLKIERVPPSIAAREYTDDYFVFFLALHPMRLMSSTWEPRSADLLRIMGLHWGQIQTVTGTFMGSRNWLVFDIMQIVKAVQFEERDSKTMQPREAEVTALAAMIRLLLPGAEAHALRAGLYAKERNLSEADKKNLTDLIERAKEIAVADNINVEQALRRLSPPDNPTLAAMIRLLCGPDTSMQPGAEVTNLMDALRAEQHAKKRVKPARQPSEAKSKKGKGK